MTKLALSDEILMKIDKPARYIGNELNSIKKDKEKVAIRFAMCFPDVYEIGMSHLGVQILYDMFNKMEDVWCERVYSPWPDLHKIMKEEHIPLFGLESQEPIKNLDFIGFTLNYEMCYTNVLQILDLGQIPLLAKDRTEDDPLVIGGWQTSLICFIWERVKFLSTNCLIFIKKCVQREKHAMNFYMKLLKCLVSMCHPSMK